MHRSEILAGGVPRDAALVSKGWERIRTRFRCSTDRRVSQWLASLLAVFVCSGTARAEQIIFGLEQALTGQSNLFRSSVSSIADGNYEIRPFLQILRRNEKLSYSIEYRPSYEVYLKSNDVNGLDHFFRGTLVYDVLPVSKIRFRADVANYRSVRALAADGAGGIPDVIPQATGEITRSFVNLDYEHEVSRSTVAAGQIAFQRYSYTTPNNADSLGIAVEGSVVHALQSDFSLGGSLLGSHRRFDALGTQPSSRNVVLNANLIALFEPTPSFFVELSAGPAVILARQDQAGPEIVNRFIGDVTGTAEFQTNPLVTPRCSDIGGQPLLLTCPLTPAPGFPGSFSEQVVVALDPRADQTRGNRDIYTAFVSAEIRKEDSWGVASIQYSRGEDASAGIGTTTIRDSVTAVLVVRPFWQIEFRMRGNWNRRKATGSTNQFEIRAGPSPFLTVNTRPVAQANGLIDTGFRTETEITQYWADMLASRQLSDRLRVEVGFRYLRQERISRPIVLTTRFDNISGSLMLRYEFTPVEF